MFFNFDYATPSAYDSTRERDLVGLSVDARRPVRFHGKVVEHAFLLRVALRTMGEAIWSDDSRRGAGSSLDPVVTVHPDRLFFEAFSGDQSSYVQLRIDPALFETEGEVLHGTTNIDFTAWLWAALAEMRSSRETSIRIGAEGLEMATANAGGRFQPKVEMPDSWVRGFLALQEAMALPGTRFHGRAVDLLAAIRFMRVTKARISPRAIRYEFLPGQEPRLILEPWEEAITFKGAEHHYAEARTIRVWGRRKLRLLEKLLPFADSVSIYLKGRALPTFYVVKLPGMEFVLGLSGWTAQQWSTPGGYALLGGMKAAPAEALARARAFLTEHRTLGVDAMAELLGCAAPDAAATLSQVCRQGSALYDLERREYRHRELFVDHAAVFRRRGILLPSHRQSSQGTKRSREAMGPEP